MGSKWLGLRLEVLGNVNVLITAVVCVYFRESIPTGMAALLVTFSIMIIEWIGWTVFTISELEADSVALERLREYHDLENEENNRVQYQKGV